MDRPDDHTKLTASEVCDVVGASVRALRLEIGLSMEKLADEAGLSLGMLSKIENGQTSPSISTLTALANAANVPLTSFFRGLDEERDAVIVPAGKGLTIAHEGSGKGRKYQDLGALRGPLRHIEPVLVTITRPDEVFPLFQHAGIEYIFIVEGTVEYSYGSNRYVMRKGDTMHLHGEVPHGPVRLIDLPIQLLSLKIYSVPD